MLTSSITVKTMKGLFGDTIQGTNLSSACIAHYFVGFTTHVVQELSGLLSSWTVLLVIQKKCANVMKHRVPPNKAAAGLRARVRYLNVIHHIRHPFAYQQ